jgi:hypothetical protein
MADTTPLFCSNCQHKSVCKILINISSMDAQVLKFNEDHKTSLQSVSTVGYVCRFKLKEEV